MLSTSYEPETFRGTRPTSITYTASVLHTYIHSPLLLHTLNNYTIAQSVTLSLYYAWNGGACKRIKGNVSLFSNNQAEMNGAVEAIRSRMNNLVFFLVFRGRMTNE